MVPPTLENSDARLLSAFITPVRLALEVGWEALENKLKRYLSLDQARQQKELHELSRHELAFLRDRFLVQCEDAAHRLVPDAGIIQKRVERLHEATAEKIDRFSDPFLATV